MADGRNVLKKVLGAGIAYPMRRSDGMQLPKKDLIHKVTFYKYPRVDSFDLYRNFVGNHILNSLIPKKKIIGSGKNDFNENHCLSMLSKSIKNAQNRHYEKARE